jgi:AraC-like DNA-binding protein
MIFKDIHPHSRIQEFVRLFRIRHFIIAPDLTPTPKPFSPHPEQCITFYPRGAEITHFVKQNTTKTRSGAIVSGQYTSIINRSSAHNEFLMVIVVFNPGCLYRLTGIPSHVLQDQDLDLEDVFPVEAKMVNKLLRSSTSYDEMILIIEDFLSQVINKSKVESNRFDKIFKYMASNSNKPSVDWLSNQACLSNRQFERKCNDYIGVSPNTFSRLVRFHKSFMMYRKNPNMDWLSIAIACGYHDYQHLVKDYKDFVCATPNQFFLLDSTSLEKKLGLAY